jgi:hypothetical protein
MLAFFSGSDFELWREGLDCVQASGCPLDQGYYSPGAAQMLLQLSINKVLLEHSHPHLHVVSGYFQTNAGE